KLQLNSGRDVSQPTHDIITRDCARSWRLLLTLRLMATYLAFGYLISAVSLYSHVSSPHSAEAKRLPSLISVVGFADNDIKSPPYISQHWILPVKERASADTQSFEMLQNCLETKQKIAIVAFQKNWFGIIACSKETRSLIGLTLRVLPQHAHVKIHLPNESNEQHRKGQLKARVTPKSYTPTFAENYSIGLSNQHALQLQLQKLVKCCRTLPSEEERMNIVIEQLRCTAKIYGYDKLNDAVIGILDMARSVLDDGSQAYSILLRALRELQGLEKPETRLSLSSLLNA
ncbi:hypothetical protein BC938DRAFT_483104, partial [Jimgerdemannia flammicorona]